MSSENTSPLKTKCLILQHPQEPGVAIGTAQLVSEVLPDTVVRTGLSWPNLSKAWGSEVDNKRWLVLYLGSVRPETFPAGRELYLVTRKGGMAEEQASVLKQVEGIVILDGTWSQAKALWWRNAWLFKLKRAVLRPARTSIYHSIRKEPRKECVSTIESLAIAISEVEGTSGLREQLFDRLQQLLTEKGKARRS